MMRSGGVKQSDVASMHTNTQFIDATQNAGSPHNLSANTADPECKERRF